MKTRIDSEPRHRQEANRDRAGNNLQEFRRRVQGRWRQLSDEQLEHISGRREELSRELERTYGLSHADAETEIDDFEAGGETPAGAGSARGPTERLREFGSGNDQGGARGDKHRLH